MAYDKLVISVGAFSATFGTEGVSFDLSPRLLILPKPLSHDSDLDSLSFIYRSTSTLTSSRTFETLEPSGRESWTVSLSFSPSLSFRPVFNCR